MNKTKLTNDQSNEINSFYKIKKLIDNILMNQHDILIHIESRIKNLKAYDNDQYNIYLILGYLVSYLNENRDDILYHYRDFYDENNPAEKSAFSELFHAYNVQIDEITANQINLKKLMINNKLKNSFLSETEINLLTFIQKFKLYSFIFPERIDNYFTVDENKLIDKKEIVFYQKKIINLLKDEYYECLNHLKDFSNFKTFIKFLSESLDIKIWLLDEEKNKESYISGFEPNRKEQKEIKKMLNIYGKHFFIKN